VIQNAGNPGDVTTIALSPAGNNTFQEVFKAPANLTTQEVTYTVTVRATDGKATTTANPGSFTVQALQTPPPAPR